MTSRRPLLYAGLVLLFLLHNDFWLWSDGRLMGGLPIGLTYHLIYIAGTVVVMAALVRLAWPTQLDATEPDDRKVRR